MLQQLATLSTYVGRASWLPATLLLNLWTWATTRFRYSPPVEDLAASAIAYSYRDLESPSHVRIVELLPKDPESPNSPKCHIHHMDLNAPSLKYCGISYAWGDTSIALHKPIQTTEGSVVHVSPNLYSCLCRLQHESSTSFLWADAISINQGEDEDALRERSAQVRLMRRIFSEADEILVELGDFPEDDEILVNGFQKLESVNKKPFKEVLSDAQKNYCHSPDTPYILEKSFRQRKQFYDNFEALLSTLDLPNHKHPFWPAFERLLRRPWFRRIWIIQEMSVAKQLCFLLGKYAVPEATFRTATKRASDYRDVATYLHPVFQSRVEVLKERIRSVLRVCLSMASFLVDGFRIPPSPADERWAYKNAIRYDLFSTRKLAQFRANNSDLWAGTLDSFDLDRPNPLALHTLFSEYRYFHCSDPKDRFYGLLGLADDSVAQELYVDYEESLHDVSLRMSKYLISNEMGGLLLYHASHAASQFPSWAIALEDVKGHEGFLEGRMTGGRPKDQLIYRAAGSTKFECKVSPNLDPRLTTRGIILASIVSLTLEFPVYANGSAEHFMNHTAVWGIGVSRWMGGEAAWSGLPESDFRLKCFRTLLADLKWDDEGRMERAGDDASAVSFQKTLESSFPSATTVGELLKHKTFAQRVRDSERALVSAQLLMKVLPGRCLGMATNMGHDQTGWKGNREVRKNPQIPSTAWVCQLPGKSAINDQIAIINGCPIPFVLRKDPTSESFHIVGCCYVDREMDGDVMESGCWPQRDIVLI